MNRATLLPLLVFFAVVAGPALAQQGTTDDVTQKAEAIRKLLAELKVDEAGKELAALRKDKSADAKKLDKELSAELAKAKKLKPVAQQIRKLIDNKKMREAHALAWTTVDSFTGAVALAEIRKLAKEAREAAYLVIGDFDEGLDSAWTANDSTAELTDDPRGGKAVRWVSKAGSGYTTFFKQLKDAVSLDDFDHVTVRVRAPKKLMGQFLVRFFNTSTTTDYCHSFVALKVTADWQDLVIPLTGGEKFGKFDPKFVVAMDVGYNGMDSIELYFDDIMLARKR